MKIKEYLTDKQIMDVIDEVAVKQATKPYGIYSIPDLRQQIKLICWQKISEFDPTKRKTKDIAQALENWLSSISRNRLINLHRDVMGSNKRFKSDTDFTFERRKKLNEPVSIDAVDITYYIEQLDDINFKDSFQRIITQLSVENLDVLEAVLSGEKIPTLYRKKLYSNIEEILNAGK